MELSREFCLPKTNGGRFKHFDRAVGRYEGLSGPVTVLQITPSTRRRLHLQKDQIPKKLRKQRLEGGTDSIP